jgi:DNA polymerase III alpha subunit
MRQLQKKTGRGDFEHLVIHSSIIRPAANAYIREYVRRLKGGAWKPLHPLLENVLSETFGIMCYQEDVSRAAIALAGFSHAEGDALRKVLSKKDRARRLPDFRARFTAGAEANGVDAATALKVWEMMESFAGYSFCKPHSASYAKVSFQSAYLKAHHPAEFIAAVISNRGGYYTTFAYVSEAARMGLRVLPPDVNRSRREFYGRGREVRTGLMQIKGLSDASISSILDARAAAGPFGSVDDFARRTRLPRPESESLALAGAMDSLAGGMTRPQILWKLCALEPEKPRRMKTMELFDAPSPAPHGRPSIPPLPEYTPARLRGLEMDRLGYLCSDHPLCHYLPRRPGLKYVKGSDLGAHRGRRVRTIGWLVTGKLVYSRHGEPMEFVSFEDTHAVYETTFFPGAFAKFAHMLDRTRPYVLTGKVDEDFGAVSLTVEEAEFL